MAATPELVRLRELATPVIERAGLVVEEITLTPVGRRRLLRVTVDLGPDQVGGVPVDIVAEAARLLSDALDGSAVMGETPYVLEVTSPGVDRPLTERRHWARARGRLVRVVLTDGGATTGRLSQVDDAGVLLGDLRVGWDELRSGRVEIEFGRPADAGGTEDDPEPREGSA